MAQIITKNILSGSTDGAPITIVGTASGSANTIHTCTSSTGSDFDEVWISAWNTSSSDVDLTLGIDGFTLPPVITIPGAGTAATDGLRFVIPGLIMRNSKVFSAFASTASVIRVTGYVNEIRA